MNCEEMRTWLAAHLDEELDVVESLKVERHLSECADCRRDLEEGLVLRNALRDGELYHLPPAGLEQKLRKAVRQSAGAGTPWWPVRLDWRLAAAGALACAALVMALWLRPNGEQGIAADVLASHVRSLQADHLVDVASSDRHTVKPWFQGKLDFSPPVPDLPELVGGRLDYIGGRAVASLVYQRRQHRINVFVWPGNGNTQPAMQSENGYQIVRWRGAGMEWWAVSDLNGAELTEFAKGLAASR
jgi:anti-sigma factor RsiW